MVDEEPDSGKCRACLQRMWAGEEQARQELFGHVLNRLRRLVEHMLRAFPIVRRHDEVEDVVQGATLRLHRALGEARPQSKRELMALAAVEIRRELLDLAKHWRTLEASGAFSTLAERGGHADGAVFEPATPPMDFAEREIYARFHELVEHLPEKEREAVHLLYYAGLSQERAAELVGVSVRTLQRRWQSAIAILRSQLPDLCAQE